MANPNQKTMLIAELYKDIKEICKKFQDETGSPDIEVNSHLRELANSYEIKEGKHKFGFR